MSTSPLREARGRPGSPRSSSLCNYCPRGRVCAVVHERQYELTMKSEADCWPCGALLCVCMCFARAFGFEFGLCFVFIQEKVTLRACGERKFDDNAINAMHRSSKSGYYYCLTGRVL